MSAFTGLHRCLGLATRRYRWQAVAWMAPMWLFLLVNPIALQRTYPSFEERTTLLSQMGDAPGVRLLFGPAPATGSVGEFASWEDGGYLLWFAAIMAIMLTTALARRDEQDGYVEVLLGAGAGRWAPFATALVWALGAMAILGIGLAASLIGVNAVVGETPLRGALVFGGVTIAQGWAFVGVALVASQLVRDTSAARGLCLTFFGAAFAVRILADEAGVAWLRWLSPPGVAGHRRAFQGAARLGARRLRGDCGRAGGAGGAAPLPPGVARRTTDRPLRVHQAVARQRCPRFDRAPGRSAASSMGLCSGAHRRTLRRNVGRGVRPDRQ